MLAIYNLWIKNNSANFNLIKLQFTPFISKVDDSLKNL